MAESPDTLVLLTATYPFGQRSEPFLDAELPILARRFDRVIVVPSAREEGERRLPAGVRCETFLADECQQSVGRSLRGDPASAALLFLRAVLNEGAARAYLRHPKSYLGVVGLNLCKYRLLREFVTREGLDSAVFYDYWLENSTLALSLLRRRGVVARAVARAHGFDLYDERSRLGAVPFQRFNLDSLDLVLAVSAHGLAYLAGKHPDARGKLRLSRLGVERQQSPPARSGDRPPLVVSCSTLSPVKRVELIPRVLRELGRDVRWVHFGDGDCRPQVERAASELPDSVSWQLAGHVEHEVLIDWYRTNSVDLFISLSSSEGLPVSMMEAISFGIPILATDAGGTGEIVTSETGKLAAVEDPPHVIAAMARRLLDSERPSVSEVVTFFENHFDAGTNYNELADLLHIAPA